MHQDSYLWIFTKARVLTFCSMYQDYYYGYLWELKVFCGMSQESSDGYLLKLECLFFAVSIIWSHS